MSDSIEVVEQTTLIEVIETPVYIDLVDEVITLTQEVSLVNVQVEDSVIEVSLGDVFIQNIVNSGEAEVPYAKRTDFVGTTQVYIAEATVGSSDSSATWRIKLITFGVDGDTIETWAGGNANFDKVWNNHTSYSYN